ncbi:extracellular catalytic domain type 1 short-chain-length polyhydroxyalkanoate depolymerase [Chiayiivirga flava]|uniref:Poly(Hydroxyalkanoate) depolymerase family esterase n=1 Tax=Chiayiivirga flava TaxID=659595 RepID=A0A7W8G0H7_9GAMM|nr:PHB depolymerase family esterase [Chiayiivirga flava]MBB5208314.1 poly(hydroxyalkanoate) depolymerase family esterase [Chiayiivirga flava]
MRSIRAIHPVVATACRRAARLAALALLPCMVAAPAFGLSEVTGFGSNPGNLKMFTYIPAGLPANAPVVVALHGCTQSAASYDAETGWQLLADRWKFALVLPQQQNGNNSSACFNWFEAGDIARGQGEALSIKQMVDRTLADHGGDTGRIFVTGLSAGAAMTAAMLATYPDVFDGGAILAGIPYNCGTGTTAAFSCMNPGSDLSPAAWGNKVRAAYSSWSGPWPRVSIWHGDADYTVRPANATEAMEQWTNVHGVDQTPDISDTLAGYPHKVYQDANGVARVETVLVTGMGHGTPVDPGTGETQCGTAGAYILDVNICSSYYIGRFWGLDNLDAIAPSVALTAPANGASVSGNVAITASASDNVGVAQVEFLVDGALLGSDTSAPYAATWNAAGAANGSHVLQARATDLAGNVATSASRTVNVSGGIVDTTAPTAVLVFPGNGASLSGTVTLSADAGDDFGVTAVDFLLDGALLGSGNRSGQAGPWTLDWNTTGVANGAHTLAARARDAAGNIGTSASAAITVNQNVPALGETFSDANGDGSYFDVAGWSGDFVANALNATLGGGASQSSYGAASSGTGCSVGLKTKFLSRSVTLGPAPRLSYARKLDLKANTNSSYSAYFRVKIGNVTVDDRTVTYAAHVDADWVRREEIDLSAFANQTVTLRFEVGANANVCLEAYARANVDDIRIVNAQQDADIVAPAVNLVAPANGATLSGSVDLTASASDASGVAKVEFYANGSLLGVDTNAPWTFTWNTAAMANGSVALMAKAYDPAGNVGSDDDTTVTVSNGGGSTPTVVTFANEDANDGYLKAAADGSGVAIGTLESSMGLALGRGTDGKFNRALLSFDTSALPDGASIVSATLTVTYRSASGNPWANPSANTLLIDARNGCFGGCALETSDYAAAATASGVADLLRFTGGTQGSSAFSAAGLAAINRSGRTQLRLRFAGNPTSTNYVWIDKGASATLRIEYLP